MMNVRIDGAQTRGAGGAPGRPAPAGRPGAPLPLVGERVLDLGLGADDFLAVNPRLIYASAFGFGRTGPYSDKLALDLTIQAMSGQMSAAGENRGRPLNAGA